MSGNVIDLNEKNFAETIKTGITLVDFWAEWCMPCRMQGPIMEEVAKEIGNDAKICKLNVDHNRNVSEEFGITGIPSILIFKDGEVVKQFVGVQSGSTLISAIKTLA
jgi:thioredoxin 1